MVSDMLLLLLIRYLDEWTITDVNHLIFSIVFINRSRFTDAIDIDVAM